MNPSLTMKSWDPHVHSQTLHELARKIRDTVHNGAFWAIVVLAVLLSTVFVLALYAPNEANWNMIPQNPYPVYMH